MAAGQTAACDERRAESGTRKSTGKGQYLRVTPLCAVFQDCANPTEGKYIPPTIQGAKKPPSTRRKTGKRPSTTAERVLKLFYIKDQGRQIPIEDGEGGNVFTQCGDCGTEFEVDLVEAIRNGCDIYASSVYCPACSAKRLKAKKETDREIKLLAERYEDCGITEEIIRNLMDKKADLDDRAKLIGIRLGLGHEFHREELFSVDDLCHVTGETPEEALTRMREAGVSPITVSPAPWLKGGAS